MHFSLSLSLSVLTTLSLYRFTCCVSIVYDFLLENDLLLYCSECFSFGFYWECRVYLCVWATCFLTNDINIYAVWPHSSVFSSFFSLFLTFSILIHSSWRFFFDFLWFFSRTAWVFYQVFCLQGVCKRPNNLH